MTGRVVLIVLAFTALTATSVAQHSIAQERKMPDFAHVTTVAKARALAAKGVLVKRLAFPSEVGGQDIPENTLYLPPEAAAAKDLATGTLVRFTREGRIDAMDVVPDYRGKSVVPTRIAIKTRKKGKPAKFELTIEVW